jgi:hypothetical protein
LKSYTSAFRPPEFSDVIAKNVTKIPWNKIVDNLETVDVDELEEDFGEDDSDKKAAKELMIFDSIREAAKDKIVPAAGPWAGVAKCLL